MEINRLLRPHLQKFSAYRSARDECATEATVYLDANENPQALSGNEGFNRYPDPHQRDLKEKIAGIKQVAREQVFLGNGSDEAIDLMQRAFCIPGQDKIMVLPPTYGMYAVCAQLNDVPVVQVPLTEAFDLDVAAILNNLEQVKIIYICSPNNPSASLADREAVQTILRHFEGLVVVDEAYADFSTAPSWLPDLKSYPNLVVLQTFSKAWGLAGIRLGMAFAHPQIVSVLDRIKYPYNVNSFTQTTALNALDRQPEAAAAIDQILKNRSWLAKALQNLPVVENVFPSQANFLLVRFSNAHKIFNYLLGKGIVVRDRSNMIHCKGCLRITVGTEAENRKLIESLKNEAGYA